MYTRLSAMRRLWCCCICVAITFVLARSRAHVYTLISYEKAMVLLYICCYYICASKVQGSCIYAYQLRKGYGVAVYCGDLWRHFTIAVEHWSELID